MERVRFEELRMKQEVKEEGKETEKLLCPKAGTATSSPSETESSQSIKGFGEKRLKMNEKLVEQLLEQLQQENQQPQNSSLTWKSKMR